MFFVVFCFLLVFIFYYDYCFNFYLYLFVLFVFVGIFYFVLFCFVFVGFFLNFIIIIIKDIMHHEYFPPGKTVNQHFYREVLGRLRGKGSSKKTKPVVQQVDCSSRQCSFSFSSVGETVFATERTHNNGTPFLFAPWHFLLFPKLKCFKKGTQFGNVEATKRSTTNN